MTALPRIVRSRVPAEKWSIDARVGEPAVDVLGDARLDITAAHPATTGRLHTDRDRAHLLWRYGFEPLRYRALTLDGDPAAGCVVFRLRRRGHATEAALCEVVVPGGDDQARRSLESELVRRSGADYAIALGSRYVTRSGYIRLPGQGPTLTWRALDETVAPPLRALDLTLGDVELF